MAGEYIIAGGRADARRLARQAEVMAPATAAFLTRAGLAAGAAALDVGCGDGQVTIAMARMAGPRGRAVGVDVDADALAIARQAADRAGGRARFVRADAAHLGVAGPFDLVYARLVLSHLIDPCAALRAMRAAARPGGVVAVEDLNLGTLRSEPPAPALDDLQAVYGATVRFHGGDPTIGPRLRALLSAGELEHVHEYTVENAMGAVEEKAFPYGAGRQHASCHPGGRGRHRKRARCPRGEGGDCGTRPSNRLLPGPHPSGLGEAATIAPRAGRTAALHHAGLAQSRLTASRRLPRPGPYPAAAEDPGHRRPVRSSLAH